MKAETVKLGDYLYIKGRIGWKGLKKNEYLPKGNYRIINGESLTDDGINWDKAGYISEERYFESPEIMLQTDDILLSKDGTIGKIGYVSELEKPTSVASGIFVVRNEKPEIIETRFIYYYLSSPYFKRFIQMRTEGSVIPHLYQKDFVTLDFPLFEVDIQKKIVSILQSIDDKIETNKEINRNLSEQVALLYKSWFIDYDINNGVCPEDWKDAILGNIAEIGSGKRPPMKQTERDEGIAIPIVGASSVMGYTNDFLYDSKILVTGRVGTHGIVQRINEKCWPSDNTLVITTSRYEYVNQILLNIDYKSLNRGSTQPLITQGDLKKTEILLPSDTVLDRFEEIAGGLMAQYEINNVEINKLVHLRDTLLPKLMSGELDVSDLDI